jgi:hypothetical protein
MLDHTTPGVARDGPSALAICAATPATCGVAIDVPEMVLVAVLEPFPASAAEQNKHVVRQLRLLRPPSHVKGKKAKMLFAKQQAEIKRFKAGRDCEHELQPVHAVGREPQLVLVVGQELHDALVAVRHRRAQLHVQRQQRLGHRAEVALQRHARVRELEERRQAPRAAVVGGGRRVVEGQG